LAPEKEQVIFVEISELCHVFHQFSEASHWERISPGDLGSADEIAQFAGKLTGYASHC
jgi:hypothetical protein